MGERFGHYELLTLLGQGGMGEVWLARDSQRDREVAVKRISSWRVGDTEFAARFRRECALAARLSSPHIVPIHSYGEIDGRLYLEMPLLPGTSLATLIADGPFTPSRSVEIITQVARALSAAHRNGLVHRDVKPSNVLVSTTDDGYDHAYLIDFGIAKASNDTGLSGSGQTVGTPAYMAPECFVGEADADARSDIYSLGCVLYETLTGERPFKAQHVGAYALQHVTEPPPRPSSVAPTVPPELDAVVVQALAKDPDDRFPTAAAMAAAARTALVAAPADDEATTAVDGGRPQPTTRIPKRSPSDEPPTETRSVPPRGAVGPGGPPKPPTWLPPTAGSEEPEDPDRFSRMRSGSSASARRQLPVPQPARLQVRVDYRIVDHALEHGSPVPFVDNQPAVDRLRQRIEHSRGGALLVTGFNGVGKTTVVRRALAELRARMPTARSEPQPLVEVWLEVPSPVTPDELMVKLIRNLCEGMRRSGVLDRLPDAARVALDTAYRRTSLSLQSRAVDSRERSAELKGGGPIPIPVAPGVTRKRISSIELEQRYLEYTLAGAEHDFRQIIADLRPGLGGREVQHRRGPRSWRRTVSPPWTGQLVVVIDELDKLTAEVGGAACLESLLRELKSVFTSTDVHFVFVGGADVHSMARAAEQRGSSVWNGVFGRVVYVPCLRRGAAAALLDGILAGRAPGLVRTLLCDYLEYRGHGLPRRVLSAINEAVQWPDDPRGGGQLVVDEELIRRATFFAEVERRLGPLWTDPRTPGPGNDPIDLDRHRIATYLMVDWALSRGNGTFTASDFAAADQDLRPDPEMVADNEVADLLAELANDRVAVLVRHTPPRIGRTVMDVDPSREPVYRVNPALIDAQVEANTLAGLGTIGDGRYRLDRELYRGAITRTYQGLDLHTNRPVVVKAFDLPELMSVTPARERFQRETDLARRVEHANLAANLDLVTDDTGRLALVSDFVPGWPLPEMLRRWGGSGRLAVAVGWGMADLLDHLHQNGIVRLGLKPSRIVVQQDLRPVLVDLGLARHIVEPTQLTALGAVVATPGYAAPEQLRGGVVDVRSDLYSLGLILHEVLTGRPVRTDDDLRDLVDKTRVERVDVDGLRCSPALREAIGALLVHDPQHRCPHPKEALRLFANSPEARSRQPP